MKGKDLSTLKSAWSWLKFTFLPSALRSVCGNCQRENLGHISPSVFLETEEEGEVEPGVYIAKTPFAFALMNGPYNPQRIWAEPPPLSSEKTLFQANAG